MQVTVKGRPLLTRAFGQSMPGVPATTNMHFRNGAVAISYMSTLLLRLVDEGKVKLSDKVSRWLPNLPYTNRVTLGMLAAMTAGYHDFALATTFKPSGFNAEGGYTNYTTVLYAKIGAILAPRDRPPMPTR